MTFLENERKQLQPDSTPRLINMNEEKGMTMYTLRVCHPDGSSDHYYNLTFSDLRVLRNEGLYSFVNILVMLPKIGK